MAISVISLSLVSLLLPIFRGIGYFRAAFIPGGRPAGGLLCRYVRHSFHLWFRFKQYAHRVLLDPCQFLDWNATASSRQPTSGMLMLSCGSISVRHTSYLAGLLAVWIPVEEYRLSLIDWCPVSLLSFAVPKRFMFPDMISSFTIESVSFLHRYTWDLEVFAPITQAPRPLLFKLLCREDYHRVCIGRRYADPFCSLCQEEQQVLSNMLERFVHSTLLRCHHCCRNARYGVVPP